MKVSYIKWVLVGVVLAVFVPWFLIVMSRESSSQDAIESDKTFSDPHVAFRFSKTIPWDPQSFLGRGRAAGFWEWSEKGVFLTPKGQNLFGEEGKDISGDLVMGKRKITSIKSVQPNGDDRDVLFIYTWTDLTDMTKLLSQPPEIGKEYEGTAKLSPKGGDWVIKSLTTPDFTRATDILTAETKR